MGTPNTQTGEQTRAMAEVSEKEVVYSAQLSYHEMADVPVQATDVIEQLNANLAQLADLQGRMQFMMKEIRYLLKL